MAKPTTKQIEKWAQEARDAGATHLLVMVDRLIKDVEGFFAVLVMPGETLAAVQLRESCPLLTEDGLPTRAPYMTVALDVGSGQDC